MAPAPQRDHETQAPAVIRATLPVSTADGLFLNPTAARAYGEQLAATYRHASPYPHIAIDDFLPADLIAAIVANFPSDSAGKNPEEYALNYKGIQEHKRQVFPNDCNAFCRDLFGFFNSAPFLQFLEGITGIDGLIADPYFHGGGFHETSRGGKLGIHADFRLHEQLHLERRLNLLIYLNPDWKEEYGGQLEIWDPTMQHKVHSIAPLLNRCAIFNTDATSYHGHPEPLTCPEGMTRKSIALYYYTASTAIYAQVASSSTMYMARPGESALSKKQAAKLRWQNHLKDVVPPILFRALRQLKQRL
jgi:Rps23 Pro-64 3,4-dihydroxylase Tpa1-like proline 4-hydroxylase